MIPPNIEEQLVEGAFMEELNAERSFSFTPKLKRIRSTLSARFLARRCSIRRLRKLRRLAGDNRMVTATNRESKAEESEKCVELIRDTRVESAR